MVAEEKKDIYLHSEIDSTLKSIAQKVLDDERITVEEGGLSI